MCNCYVKRYANKSLHYVVTPLRYVLSSLWDVAFYRSVKYASIHELIVEPLSTSLAGRAGWPGGVLGSKPQQAGEKHQQAIPCQ